jgi:putative ABC transport system substrate-binding protein
MHRIGVLWHGANAEEEAIYLAALREGLRDSGYVEGENVVLEMRFPAEQYERFFILAAELAQQKWTYWFRQQELLPSPVIVQ